MSRKSILQLIFISFVFAALSASAAPQVFAQTIITGQIIYSRLPVAGDTIGTVWAVNADGTNDRQVAVGNQPRISANGRYLLFRRSTGAFSPYQNGQLWVRDLVANTESAILSYVDFQVGNFFTPDSTQIVFDFSTSILRMNRDGTNQMQIFIGSGFDDFPVVRTSDSLIAFHRYNGTANAGIYTVNFDGTNLQKVPNTLADVFPSWSPDGQFIAYGSNLGFGAYPYELENLFRIRPDGTSQMQLTSLGSTNNFAGGIAWMNDGTRLVVAANIGGVAGLYFINTDGSGTITQLPITAGANPDFVGGIAPTAPTAANVSVGGRVFSGKDRGIAKARITLTDASGASRSALTSAFGYYRFDDVQAGETYIFSVAAKRYSFSQSSQVRSIVEDTDDVNFVADN